VIDIVSDIATFVLKRDVKLQLTNYVIDRKLTMIGCVVFVLYTLNHKKRDISSLTITLANLTRFL